MQSDYSSDRIITHNNFKFPISILANIRCISRSAWRSMGHTNVERVLRDIFTGCHRTVSQSAVFLWWAHGPAVCGSRNASLQSIDYRLGFGNVSLPRFQFSYKQHSTYRNLFSMTELGCKFTCHSENPEV